MLQFSFVFMTNTVNGYFLPQRRSRELFHHVKQAFNSPSVLSSFDPSRQVKGWNQDIHSFTRQNWTPVCFRSFLFCVHCTVQEHYQKNLFHNFFFIHLSTTIFQCQQCLSLGFSVKMKYNSQQKLEFRAKAFQTRK